MLQPVTARREKHVCDAVCFGEALLCYKVRTEGRSVKCLRAVGGAELNTACGMGSLGLSVRYLTVLPASPVSLPILRCLRKASVDTSHIVMDRSDSSEIGTGHYLGKSIYQRRNSAFCQRTDVSAFNWEAALDGAKVFHSSGITLSLSAGAAEAWHHAMKCARRFSILTVFDLNWRPALTRLPVLWDAARGALRKGLLSLLVVKEYLLPSLCDLEGIPVPDHVRAQAESAVSTDRYPDSQYREQICVLLRTLREAVRVPLLACIFRRPLPRGNGWQARWSVLSTDGFGVVSTDSHPVFHLAVEPLGGGDAWIAGFVNAILTFGRSPDECEGNSAKPSARNWGYRAGESGWARMQRLARRKDGGSYLRGALCQAVRDGDVLAALAQGQTGPCMVSAEHLNAFRVWDPDSGPRIVLGWAQKAIGQAHVRRRAALRECPVILRLTAEDHRAVLEHGEEAPILRAALRAGVRCFEVNVKVDGWMKAALSVSRSGAVVGVGHVTSPTEVVLAARGVLWQDSSRWYVSSPIVCPDLLRAGRQAGVPVYPGVATATDVVRAARRGIREVNVHPLDTACGGRGESLLRALSAAHPRCRWIASSSRTLASVVSSLAVPGVLACAGELETSWAADGEEKVAAELQSVVAATRRAALTLAPKVRLLLRDADHDGASAVAKL